MFLDLHTHSIASDDSRATVEQYVKWIGVLRRKGYQIDGFVLTEHRQFDFNKDYSQLAKANGVVILKGAELDTNSGHFLVFGVTPILSDSIDFTDVGMNALELIRLAMETGGIAIPAHPGRFGIGLYEFIKETERFKDIRIVEYLNGSNRPGEQERAEELINRHGYMGTGGSDAHLVSAIGTCMTDFERDIATEEDLVRELTLGRFRAVKLEETGQ